MAATLSARPRTERGKNAARALRRSSRIPAVMYGHGDEPRTITVDSLELSKLLSSISVENTLIELQVEGAEATRALIREVQTHPFKPLVLHVDFFLVHAGEKLHLPVPVHLIGTPVGVSRDGGVLQQSFHQLDVECLPRDIPAAVELEVSHLGIGDSLHVHEVRIPNVKILNDAELVVCSVTTPTVAELPETPETEPGVGGEVEPELIRDRAEDAEGVPAEQG